ncbi:glycosyl transferase family 2 [Stanieria cyanosphaera PCC 7437]|uniref:Glycosyl transferase family 2 n=1 Tax=Stanieria cyanosphaera (strain ATCC 29371 / PCC 7437) TaxID=111780 RepID=K9XQA9_STAC7|nr:glycosyltransferase family 2 protein [Stanieria cyanosphaera]AFZ33852.1 glycosyl transferase family 2 [Stanieria cyanosphaera PCC 7437]
MVISTDSFANDLPSVTIAIPAYNEEAYIEKVVQKFLASQYPRLIEIIIADGNSSDRTQEIVKQISLFDSRVKLIINPHKIQSHALNIILQKAKGDIFLRADAHCEYASDYVEKCVKALLETKADNAGGAQRFVAAGAFQAGVALAANSILGNGGAKYRNINYDGYADTVYLGCFWRKALLAVDNNSNLNEINVFDTSQITNQDAELNQKLLSKNPEAIYVSSDIKVWYYPRKTWKSLWIQYFKYGRGRYLTSVKHPEQMQLRGKLPFLFILTLILLLLLDLAFSDLNLHIREIILAGLLIPLIESLRVNWKLKERFATEIWRGKSEQIPSLLVRWFYTGIVILTMPLAHFFGYGYQLFKNKILRIEGW